MQYQGRWCSLVVSMVVVAVSLQEDFGVDATRIRGGQALVAECLDGTSWKKECNSCFCANGRGKCTQNICSPELKPFNEDLETPCVDGTSWKKECNSCFCDNGLTTCTLKFCVPELKPLKEDLDPEVTCVDGTSWKEECNTCTCANGVASCSLKICVPEIEPVEPQQFEEVDSAPECEEGMDGPEWHENCNSCVCANGVPVCTMKDCFN